MAAHAPVALREHRIGRAVLRLVHNWGRPITSRQLADLLPLNYPALTLEYHVTRDTVYRCLRYDLHPRGDVGGQRPGFNGGGSQWHWTITDAGRERLKALDADLSKEEW